MPGRDHLPRNPAHDFGDELAGRAAGEVRQRRADERLLALTFAAGLLVLAIVAGYLVTEFVQANYGTAPSAPAAASAKGDRR